MKFDIPERVGGRPRTSTTIPQRQLDQIPSREIYDALLARFTSIPGLDKGPSGISVPGACALHLPPGEPCNQRFGFIHGREMAHVHPPDDGSFHMILAPDDCATVIARGWGEHHIFVPSGRALPTVVLVYAPRDLAEIDVTMRIVEAAIENARDPKPKR